ncbi:MAG TPA: hemolysin family protein [Polyangiaceae bacterium]|jgi:putative hemolysin|nr:hemolysin family protein [Polyangiaceae bacterium]
MLFEFAIILGLVLLNGLLAGAEIAIVGVSPTRLKQLLEQRGRRGRAVQMLRAHPERFFATVQIGITVIGASAAAFGGATFASDLTPIVAQVGVLAPYAHQISLALVISLLSVLSIVLGELVPKSLALRYADSYAILLSGPILWLSTAARPVVWFLTGCSNLVLALFGDRTTFVETRLSPAELRELVDEATQTGSLDPTAGEIAVRALEFASLTASHVMVPRTQVVGIAADSPLDEVRRTTLEHGYSRLPVYRGHLDDIIGYVLVKDLLAIAWEGRLFLLSDLIRPPYVVTENEKAASLLSHMREQRIHLAVVVDEHGGTSGIVTLEDLLEEFVGDIVSETAEPETESLHLLSDGSLVTTGDTAIRDINRELGTRLPEGSQWSTVGGLCAVIAGRIPETGELLTASDGSRIEVQSASERRVFRVRVVPEVRPAADDETSS